MNYQIVIFCYNRPDHLNTLLNSLKGNDEFFETDICFALDAPKNNNDQQRQLEIMALIDNFQKLHPNTKVVKQEKNLGSKIHIISTLNREFLEYSALIVLEDDLVLDKFFLSYMISALKKYQHNESVFHISGFSFLDTHPNSQAYFTRYMNCWGWASWADRWQKLELDTNKVCSSFSKSDVWDFNCNGSHDFFRQLIQNKKGIISTWAIYWYATIFKNSGLCLVPPSSLVINNGRDGSGERDGSKLTGITLHKSEYLILPSNFSEDKEKYLRLVQYFVSQDSRFKKIIRFAVYCFPASWQKPTMRFLIKIRKLVGG